MKMIFVVALTLSTSVVSCAQDVALTDVPSVVLNSFKATFADARDVEWEMKNQTYEVEFELQDTDHQAYIDKAGKLLTYKYDIHQDDLPLAVLQVIKKSYSASHLDDAECIEKGGKKFYRVELEGKSIDREITFSEEGKEVTI